MTPFDDLCIDISPKTKKKTSHKQLYSNLKKYSHFADCVIIYSVYLYFSFGINLRDFLIFIIYRNIKTERGNFRLACLYLCIHVEQSSSCQFFTNWIRRERASYIYSLLSLLGALFINIYSGIKALCMHISSSSLSISLLSNMIINY